jgi:hypothetical protein
MFKFRNDHVHDKVVDLSHDRTSSYNGKFPDPIAGTLDLGHAMYAAATYWSLVEQLHKLIELRSEQFHRHYNLSPWRSPADRVAFESLANEYRNELAGD